MASFQERQRWSFLRSREEQLGRGKKISDSLVADTKVSWIVPGGDKT
jgi:hypothetical protein